MKTHGGDIFGIASELGVSKEACLDFSANMNPLGIPLNVIKAMKDSLNQTIYYPDPDSTELIEKISVKYQVDHSFVTVGNGAADLIYRLVYAVKPGKVLMPAPTFLEYQEALSQTGTDVRHYILHHDDGMKVGPAILNEVRADIDMIFLCNPNNPTGLLLEQELLHQIIQKARNLDILVVIDECFLDFTGREKECSMIRYLMEFPNLFLLKSITKMFSVPGIRFGYGFCANQDLNQRIKHAGQSWPINIVASFAAIAALEEDEFVETTVRYVTTERNYLIRRLKDMGVEVFPGEANYLLLFIPAVNDLYTQMLEQRIIIRRCCNYQGLDEQYYRIAVKTRRENKKFCDLLENILDDQEDGR